MTLTKKILLGSFAAAMAFSGAAFASAPGFYVGGQLGWSNTNPSSSDVTGTYPGFGNTVTSASSSGTGFAWGLNTGYQFDQNWAAELGYTRFANTSYTYRGTAAGVPFVNGTASYNQDAWSVVGKGILPFDNGFGVYGKLGVAYVRASSITATLAGITANSGNQNAWRPTAGVGVKYDFNQNVSADVSVTRIFKGGNLTNDSDTAMVGVAYNFG
jgi:opacity protein-like surface antigen